MIPAYNSEHTIRGMLDSLDRQTYPNLDVLISDDCSTDATARICREFATSRPNVKLVEQNRNLGWVGNSNFLLGAADGDFAFFAFHDDELAPTYVERLVSALMLHPEALVAFSDIIVSKEGRSPVELSFDRLTGLTRAVDRGRVMIAGSENWWIPFRGLVRTSAIRQVGPLRRHMYGERNSDWFWLLGLSLRGPFVRVPEGLYTKHKRPEGVAARWRRNAMIRLVVLGEGIREVFRAPLPLTERLGIITHGLLLRLRLR